MVEGKESKGAKWWGLSKGKMYMLKYVLYNWGPLVYMMFSTISHLNNPNK